MERDELGVSENRWVNRILLLAVMVVVVIATFRTGETNEKLAETQRALAETTRGLEIVQQCNIDTISEFARVAEETDSPTIQGTQANVELQTAQLKFLTIVARTDPASTELEEDVALANYVKALGRFTHATGELINTAKDNPYPTEESYEQCIEKAGQEKTSE